MSLNDNYLKQKYNPEGSPLRNAQHRMVELMSLFDEFCQENALKYWLDFGTLLGAARHGGFIPWDDDVDVMMPFDDYVRMKKLMLKNKGIYRDAILQCNETDPGFFASWMTLRDLKSEYIQDSNLHNRRKYRGLQIDIFPCVNYYAPPLMAFCRHYQNWLIDRPLIRSSNISSSPLSVLISYKIFHKVILPLCNAVGRLFKHDEFRFYYGVPFESKRKLKNIYPLTKISFENIEFSAPANVSAYLTDIYGDWQKIPPADKIVTHNVEVVFKNRLDG